MNQHELKTALEIIAKSGSIKTTELYHQLSIFAISLESSLKIINALIENPIIQYDNSDQLKII